MKKAGPLIIGLLVINMLLVAGLAHVRMITDFRTELAALTDEVSEYRGEVHVEIEQIKLALWKCYNSRKRPLLASGSFVLVEPITAPQWQTFTHEQWGFSVEYPPDVRVWYDVGSDAIRFQKDVNGKWVSGWTIWRNEKDIAKFSSTQCVIDTIAPDDMQPTESKIVEHTPVEVDGRLADLVTVTVDRDEPWSYVLVFLDMDTYQFEIARNGTNWDGFERFYQSFRVLE